jgi:glycosyltransferase involved in cell wall biosynthesis
MIRVGLGVTALCKGLKRGNVDGIGTYTRELIAQLSSERQASPATVSSIVPFAFNAPIPKQLGSIGHKLIPYSLGAAWSALSNQDFPGIRQLSKQVDLVHASDHYIPHCKTVPLVATLMDALPLSHPEWSSSEFRTLKNALWRKAIGWADSIITISEYSKLQLSKWANIPIHKITVIPLGVGLDWFDDVSETKFAQIKRQYALPESFFIAVGTLQPRKNLIRTIRAHKMLPVAVRQRVPLLIVGNQGWKSEDILRLIAQESAGGSIRWLKHVPQADLLPLLKLSNALVFPSLAEGFGLPVLEAFAAKVPVITSSSTSLPEVAGDAALLVNPLNTEEIRTAMERVLEDVALMESLKHKGFDRAKQFTWSACAASTFDVYRNTLL